MLQTPRRTMAVAGVVFPRLPSFLHLQARPARRRNWHVSDDRTMKKWDRHRGADWDPSRLAQPNAESLSCLACYPLFLERSLKTDRNVMFGCWPSDAW